MKRKIRVGVVFGGKSAEHEISLLSAKNIYEALDRKKYEPLLIGIDKNGEWHVRDSRTYLSNANHAKKVVLQGAKDHVALVSKQNNNSLVSLSKKNAPEILDVIFPVMHGTYGEDGAIQGLLKMAGIPFVGAGILGSAVGMDKDVMKRLLRDGKLAIAKFLCLRAEEAPRSFESVQKELGLPFFVKPANLGSSVGVSKVKAKKDYLPALKKAFLYDHKILIEEFIDGREIECCILGDQVSLPGEVVTKDEFYSYEAKYLSDSGTIFHMPAKLDAKTTKKIQNAALQTYKVLCCEGMARVDLFLKKNGEIYINEINTIPGFTNTSMYPKLWEASGIDLPYIVDKLIHLALERDQKERSLKTTFA
jgi:D-alanine-D-alanine ligase